MASPKVVENVLLPKSHPLVILRTHFKRICKYVKSEDLYNLYQATKGDEIISDMFFGAAFFYNVEISGPWFSGPQAVDHFNQIVQIANPPNLLFQECKQPVSSSFALRLLEITAKHNQIAPEKKIIRMRMLDLSGVCVSENLVKYLSENFKIIWLKIGKTTAQFDRFLKVEGLEHFKISSNETYLANNLKIINFPELKTLEIMDCRRLILGKVGEYLIQSQWLTTLTLIDCVSDERNAGLAVFLETVFSDQSRLTEFTLGFKSPESVYSSGFFQINPSTFCILRRVNLQNCGFLRHCMQAIVNGFPLLESLNIRGIQISSNLSFAKLFALNTLSMDYFKDCLQVVNTIKSSKFCRLEIINRWSKNNKKRCFVMDLESLQPWFCTKKQRNFMFQNCKIANLPKWLTISKSLRQLSIVRKNDIFQIIS